MAARTPTALPAATTIRSRSLNARCHLSNCLSGGALGSGRNLISDRHASMRAGEYGPCVWTQTHTVNSVPVTAHTNTHTNTHTHTHTHACTHKHTHVRVHVIVVDEVDDLPPCALSELPALLGGHRVLALPHDHHRGGRDVGGPQRICQGTGRCHSPTTGICVHLHTQPAPRQKAGRKSSPRWRIINERESAPGCPPPHRGKQ